MAAKPVPIAPSITLNEPGPFAIGDAVTFSFVTGKLHGDEYPMIILDAVAADGTLLCRQLDHADAAFILGGGWSLWREVGGPAICTAFLYAYTKPLGQQTIRLLATAEPFQVG